MRLLSATLSRAVFCLLIVTNASCPAEQPPSAPATSLSFETIRNDAGSAPADPGPLATDLSPALTRSAIQRAMRKVADWQLVQAETKFNQDWTYAPLYLGLLATSKTTGDSHYHDAVLKAAERFRWKLWSTRPFHADDEAIAQVYEALYLESPESIRLIDTQATFDELLRRPDVSQNDLWWWCDALFMAPAGLARLTKITGDPRYLQRMNAEWALTQLHLYDPVQHLFSRDATFLDKKEPNGQKLFWSRGNAWVLAGLANLLQAMPAHDPSRRRYVKLFQDMALRISRLQGTDGLWRPGLLDAAAHPQPEVSGTAFYIYALAWGVNHGLLSPKLYGPNLARGWRGILKHIYADGRLGSIQPIGSAPDAFTPSSSYVYGVGAFLLAGSELAKGVRP